MDIVANQPVVFDNGSGTTKAGVAGEQTPKVAFPAYVGRPKHDRSMIGSLEGDAFVGDRAQQHRGLLRLAYPMEHGIVEDWSDMERIWSHAYGELHLNSEDHPVLMTETPLNSRKQRETAAQVLFETFNVPAAYFSIPAVLALYAAGKTSGVVLDIGDGVTHVVPVYQGFSIKSATMRSDTAGRNVTEFLQLLLRKQGVKLTTSAEQDIVRHIKQQHCRLLPQTFQGNYRPLNHLRLQQQQQVSPLNIVYKLPDGQRVTLGDELRRAPEILFEPVIIGSEDPGCHQLLADSIARSDRDLRKTLYENITLSGGSTLTRGLGDRLLNELKALAPTNTLLKIAAPPDRQYSAWIGGSILASLSTFTKMWLSADDWQERPERIHHLS